VTDFRESSRAFSIEHHQRLLVETDGRAWETSEVFVKVYRDMGASGLLAELSGSELKVLLALGLEARVLGGDAEAERHFARLKAVGAVTDEDRGRLFCYLDRDTIAGRTGLSTRTVSTTSRSLVARKLIEERTVRNRSGQHDYNVYFIRPAAHIGKFDFNCRSPANTGEGHLHRGKIFPTVHTEGTEPPAADFPYVKKGSNDNGSEGLDALVFARFAERQNATSYRPTNRDLTSLNQLRTEGFSQDQILIGVDKAFALRSADSEPIRRFTYCAPVIRSLRIPRQKPQPVLTGSPAVTPVAHEHTPCDVETAPTPAELSPDAQEDSSPSCQAPGCLPDMEAVFESVQKTGWLVGPALQTALTAKAVRVEEAARQQGSDGAGWVSEAMLIALGRKLGPMAAAQPTDAELLAYTDGILGNWIAKGHPRMRREAGRLNVARSEKAHGDVEQVQEWSEIEWLVDTPVSEEERLWARTLSELQLQMARATFDQWLKGSRLIGFEQLRDTAPRLVVGVTNPRAVEWLEHRLKPVVQRTVNRLLGCEVDLQFLPMNLAEAAHDRTA
jgi:hypothetical protein